MNKRLQSIVERFEDFGKRNLDNSSHFMEAFKIIFRSLDARNATVEGLLRLGVAETQQVQMGNFLVNLTTGIELLFKQLVTHVTVWKESGYELLLKENDHKISLNQAYELFREGRITRQYIIAQYYSFQSVAEIARVMNCLSGTDFFVELENVKTDSAGNSCLANNIPDWRINVTEIFEARHKFIHEGVLPEIDDEKTRKYFSTVITLYMAIISYFAIKFLKGEVSGQLAGPEGAIADMQRSTKK